MPLSSISPRHRHRTIFGAILGAVLVIGSFSIAAATPPGTVIDYEQTASAVIPQSSFGGAAGGDGWALAFTDTNVYNIFHHDLLKIACRSKTTGVACSGSGYSAAGTKSVSDGSNRFQVSMGPPIHIDKTTNRLFTMAVRGTAGIAAGTSGVVEIDLASTSSNPFVAFYPLSRDGEGACYLGNCGAQWTSVLSNTTKIGTKWYVYNYVAGVANTVLPDSRNKLLCFDLATKSACEGQPYDVTRNNVVQGRTWEPPTIAAAGNRIFVNIYGTATTNSLAQISCVDVSSTPTNCTGWPIVPSTRFGDTFTAAPAFPLLNSAGTPIGVCFPGSTANACTDFAGLTITDTAVITPALAGLANPFDVDWATTRGEAYVDGTRVFMPNVRLANGTSEVECYDFATNNLCTGFPSPKTFTLGSPTREFEAIYTVQTDPADPSCLWVMAHGGTKQIQNFDSRTGGACGGNGFVLPINNFRESPSRCAATAWKQFTLVSPTVGNFTSGTVEFADANGSAITGIGVQNFGSDGILNLTSLNLHTYPSLSRLHVRLVGTTTTAINVKMKWSAEWHTECDDGGQTAFTTTTTTSTAAAPNTTSATVPSPTSTVPSPTSTTSTTTAPTPTTVTTCARRGAPTSRQVIFSGDSAELLRSARITMRSIIAQLRVACAVTITGHAADDGDPNGDVAQDLSARRAQVVAAFLRARGIAITDINAFGKAQPIAPGQAMNRRVEITWYLPR